jgi:hypothetical protein
MGVDEHSEGGVFQETEEGNEEIDVGFGVLLTIEAEISEEPRHV